MLKDVQTQIWGQELAKFKALWAREKTRKQYDRAKEALSMAQESKLDKAKEAVPNLEKAVENLTAQLKEIDARIHGQEDGQGEPGIDQKLEAFIELRDITKSFIKYNC